MAAVIPVGPPGGSAGYEDLGNRRSSIPTGATIKASRSYQQPGQVPGRVDLTVAAPVSAKLRLFWSATKPSRRAAASRSASVGVASVLTLPGDPVAGRWLCTLPPARWFLPGAAGVFTPPVAFTGFPRAAFVPGTRLTVGAGFSIFHGRVSETDPSEADPCVRRLKRRQGRSDVPWPIEEASLI